MERCWDIKRNENSYIQRNRIFTLEKYKNSRAKLGRTRKYIFGRGTVFCFKSPVKEQLILYSRHVYIIDCQRHSVITPVLFQRFVFFHFHFRMKFIYYSSRKYTTTFVYKFKGEMFTTVRYVIPRYSSPNLFTLHKFSRSYFPTFNYLSKSKVYSLCFQISHVFERKAKKKKKKRGGTRTTRGSYLIVRWPRYCETDTATLLPPGRD